MNIPKYLNSDTKCKGWPMTGRNTSTSNIIIRSHGIYRINAAYCYTCRMFCSLHVSLSALGTSVSGAKPVGPIDLALWGGNSRDCVRPGKPCIREHIGVNWRIRLNDPYAEAMQLSNYYFADSFGPTLSIFETSSRFQIRTRHLPVAVSGSECRSGSVRSPRGPAFWAIT